MMLVQYWSNMPMPTISPTLSAAQLATLFSQLGQMESAGLPAFQAFEAVMKSDKRLKPSLTVMQRQLKSGHPIAESGYRAGLFNGMVRTLLQAAEASGRMAEIYGQLADYYITLSRQRAKVRSRLWLPGLVLAIALFVQPLPALVGSQIGTGSYLQLTLGRLLTLAVTVFVLLRMPQILAALGAGKLWHRMVLAMPVIGSWIIARQVNGLLQVLAMLLESGLAFSAALPLAVATIGNDALREQFAPALVMSGSGASVADTLAEVPCIETTLVQVVHSSEQSGRLAGGMLQFARHEAETLGRQEETLAAWLPRVIYVLIASWMAYSVMTGMTGSLPAVTP